MLRLSFLSVLLTTVAAYQVLEDKVTFILYNRNISGLPINKETLCNINANKQIKMLVHGKGSSENAAWYSTVTETYLQQGDYNVIHVDWSELAGQTDPIPIYKASDASYYVAKFIRRIHKRLSVPLDNFHLTGHSLGAHIVGFSGKHIKRALNAQLGRVTGLDAPDDDFSFDPDSEDGLQRTDAVLVVSLYTEHGGSDSRGHIDFRPNGGVHPQPGCGDMNACSHVRACDYFNEALQNANGFVATKCDSYESFFNGTCDGNDRVSLGGNLLGHEGDYYLLTNAEPPYSQS